ncbi:methylisocitrate lyase [Geomonas sp. RF6]|uniref:methylisocitrate lyase n=1 Tax=Geomonas sp. RF6 TaxID=2897342 RepID=UPI001E570D0E|nr:methylisocitrate lyase [Geomonas sp. RF6]UFS70906.1 methylisocitrate lyase [Geomonas sp. RF6]
MAEANYSGKTLRAALESEKPLQMVGAINAYSALLAERCGFRALYLSGAGVANASWGLPDLGMTTLGDVVEDVRRITAATKLPLLVDADTGWGHALMIGRTVRELTRAGAAGMHIEDQLPAKRCGHRPGKALVSTERMVERIKAAVDSRSDESFVVMARTDAVAVEGLEAAIERSCRYREAGADLLFPEALTELSQYRLFADRVGLPLLANMTEFGLTPLYSVSELASAGVAVVLYPLSAFRAMNAAALKVYRAIRQEGTQASVLDFMQTRAELYDILNYHQFEQILDESLEKEEPS